jgi:hypothetical protein
MIITSFLKISFPVNEYAGILEVIPSWEICSIIENNATEVVVMEMLSNLCSRSYPLSKGHNHIDTEENCWLTLRYRPEMINLTLHC